MTSSTWIIDFESYQIDSAFYPLEICILNVCTQQCFLFFVKYPRNYFNTNATLRYQFRRHGLHWDDGDQSLHDTVMELKRIITNNANTVKIYVKGELKHKLVSYWFTTQLVTTNKNTFNITDIGAGAPSFTALKDLNTIETCAKHAHNMQLFCARRKCYQLLPFVILAEKVNNIVPLSTNSSEEKITTANNISSVTDCDNCQTDGLHASCGNQQFKTITDEQTFIQKIFAYMHMFYITIRNRLHV
jgi:hypothetical protein